MAGGLSLDPDQVPIFADWLNARIGEQKASLIAARELSIDAIIGPGAATVALCKLVDKLGPFGAGAPQPVFALENAKISGARVIGQNHLKFIAEDASGRVECVAWRALDTPLGDAIRRGGHMHIAGRLKVNEWQGRERVQMDVSDGAVVS
jgi:single-stranded-DNA-specific exonuclease